MRNLTKLLLITLLSWPCGAAALDVTVEPGSMKSAQADMNLSGLIVRRISWEDGAVIMPVTVSSDRIYTDVKLLSRTLYLKMENCFINGCPETPVAAAKPVPVVKFETLKKLNSKIRVSNVDISFDSEIVVTVGIMASNYGDGEYWLSYPQSIGFDNPALKKEVEDTVFAAWAAENPHLTVHNSEQQPAQEEAAASPTAGSQESSEAAAAEKPAKPSVKNLDSSDDTKKSAAKKRTKKSRKQSSADSGMTYVGY